MGIKRKKGSVLEEDMYEVNFIKARRLVKGQPEYLIKWKGFDDDKSDEKNVAMEALTGTWIHNWKPAAAAAPAAAAPAAASPAEATVVNTTTATAAAKMGASSSFFAMPIAPASAHAPTAEDAAMMDDLEKYLALPVEDNLDLDVLSWWKARDHDKAADPASGRPAGLPDLAKMAAQYL